MYSATDIFLVLLLCFCLFLSFIYVAWQQYIRKWSHLNIAPGCLPLLGHMHKIKSTSFDDMLNWFREVTDENGSTFVFFFLWKPVIFTKDPELGKTLLQSLKYTTRSPTIHVFSEILGKGLLTESGKLWRERRHLITPAFHLDILARNLPILEKQVQYLVSFIKECSRENEAVNFNPFSRMFALGTICEYAMGIPMNLCTRNPEEQVKLFSTASRELIIKLNERMINPLYNFYFPLTRAAKRHRQNMQVFHSFIKTVVEERIQIENQSKEKKTKTFIDIMFEAYQKKQIDVQGMLDEISTFIFGGNETIAVSLAWMVYHIGKRAEVQEKLYKDFVDYKKRNLTSKDIITEAVYLDCVVKEVLRLTTSLSFARYIEEDSYINDIFIPKNTGLTFLMQSMHLDGKYWANPREFRPERYLEEGPEEYNFKLLPFSAGPRNCIGKRLAMAELKVAIYHLILNFKINIIKDMPNADRLRMIVDNNTEFKFIQRQPLD